MKSQGALPRRPPRAWRYDWLSLPKKELGKSAVEEHCPSLSRGPAPDLRHTGFREVRKIGEAGDVSGAIGHAAQRFSHATLLKRASFTLRLYYTPHTSSCQYPESFSQNIPYYFLLSFLLSVIKELMPNSNKNEALEKLPPQSIDAEKSLLGALMIDKDAIIKVADFLLPKDFYKKSHQEIYSAVVDLFERGESIDFLAVSSRLKDRNFLEEAGGSGYLTELINFVPTAAHVLSYAKNVQKKRILRDLIATSQEINSLGYNEAEDVDVLLDEAERKIFSIAQGSLTQNFVPIKDTLEEAFERLDRLSKHGDVVRGTPTGFKHLDNLLAGFQKSDLIILASRPSMGKSSLALNFAANIAIDSKLPVGIFSLEMSRDQIVDRLLSSLSNVDSWKLRTGRLSQEGEDNDFSRIQNAMGILAEAPIYIDDTAIINVLQMKAMARRLQAEHGLGLVIIDYLQLMESRNQAFSTVQQVSEISRSLKGMARELNVPVLAVSQLSRAVEHRVPPVPKLADLRESGSLEQDADVVMFIYREDRYRDDTLRKNIAQIRIAKHRNGPIGNIDLYFDEARTTFRTLDKQSEESSFRPPEGEEAETTLPF